MGTSQSKTAEQKVLPTNPKVNDNDKTTTATTTDDVSSGGDSESQCPVMQKRQNKKPHQMTNETITKKNDDKNLPRGHPSILKNSTGDGESKCPMKNADGNFFSLWKNKTNKPSTDDGSTTTTTTTTTTTNAAADPVRYNVYSQPIDPSNQMPAVANQLPAPNQREALSTERVQSNIPKGGYDDGTTWTYPSPQMFYNALSRKNKLGTTPESDIPSIVALHNNMNESTWTKIIQWETTLGHPSPKLLKFTGRPSDLSPKAFLKHYLFSHPLPYDRHDWTILRPDGSTMRYVIDYYHDESRAREDEESGYPALDDREAVKSLLVDVRPAVDGFDGLYGRMTMMGKRWFGGGDGKNVSFEPLPLMPTKEMKSQVEDSLKVWDDIVKNKASSSVVGEEEESTTMEKMTDEEAKRLAANFARWLKDCQEQRRVMSECTSEEDCAKASLGLTVCMAKIFCPLQHDAMTKCLNENNEADETIDKALETMALCVGDANESLGLARRDFPELFERED